MGEEKQTDIVKKGNELMERRQGEMKTKENGEGLKGGDTSKRRKAGRRVKKKQTDIVKKRQEVMARR